MQASDKAFEVNGNEVADQSDAIRYARAIAEEPGKSATCGSTGFRTARRTATEVCTLTVQRFSPMVHTSRLRVMFNLAKSPLSCSLRKIIQSRQADTKAL